MKPNTTLPVLEDVSRWHSVNEQFREALTTIEELVGELANLCDRAEEWRAMSGFVEVEAIAIKNARTLLERINAEAVKTARAALARPDAEKLP